MKINGRFSIERDKYNFIVDDGTQQRTYHRTLEQAFRYIGNAATDVETVESMIASQKQIVADIEAAVGGLPWNEYELAQRGK